MRESDNSGMSPEKLPGLMQLEATPDILRLLMESVAEKDALWKPAPDRFSIAEVLEHLSHTEGHCFRARVERMAEHDDPELELYDLDALAAGGKFASQDPEESFAHFEEQRETNLEYLRGLPASAAMRTGRHPEFGAITVAHMMNEWAFHDLGHIRQIAEIIRARKYYPHIGPFQTQYRVNP